LQLVFSGKAIICHVWDGECICCEEAWLWVGQVVQGVEEKVERGMHSPPQLLEVVDLVQPGLGCRCMYSILDPARPAAVHSKY
jgi:hypothetical protein